LVGFFLLIKISNIYEDFLNKKIKSINYLKQYINLLTFNYLFNNKFSLEDYFITKFKNIYFMLSNLSYKRTIEYNIVFFNNLQILY